jgi:hypothetical protein
LRILVILMVLSLKVNYDYAVKKLFNFVSMKISHINYVFTKIVKDSFFLCITLQKKFVTTLWEPIIQIKF